MPSTVYYGSPRQTRLEANETLPAKLDLILTALHLRDRVKGETVVIKMHTGNNLSYSTIHPVFVRRVVQAVKDGGGKPFVVDVNWDTAGAETRGYASEVIGCPVYPASGPDDKYAYDHPRPYKSIQSWKVAGLIEDASFLVNFAHIKGHPSCGFGGAFKNIALGCLAGETRSAMHDVMHYDQYFFPDRCTRDDIEKLKQSCPVEALVEDQQHPGQLHLHMEQCNQCGRCLAVAPAGSLKISPVNFHSFQEAMAIAAQMVLSTFAPSKAVHLALATEMTPVCDCFGFTSMPILPDAGVFGSDDIVALDQAVLDQTAGLRLFEENLPAVMEVHTRVGHPFRWLHGPYKDPYVVVNYAEKLGLGSRAYELVDVLPVVKVERSSMAYIAAR
jgi:uncharacterized Fe-S center protein